jgi:hypothetical protein
MFRPCRVETCWRLPRIKIIYILVHSLVLIISYDTVHGHCATNRQIAGSIPVGVSGYFFHWHNPVGRTMPLGSTQPLTEMSTRNISWEVNAAGA